MMGKNKNVRKHKKHQVPSFISEDVLLVIKCRECVHSFFSPSCTYYKSDSIIVKKLAQAGYVASGGGESILSGLQFHLLDCPNDIFQN
jgi:hypothetical protein